MSSRDQDASRPPPTQSFIDKGHLPSHVDSGPATMLAAVLPPPAHSVFSLPDLKLDASRNVLPPLAGPEPMLVLPQLDERSAGVDRMIRGLEDGLWWSRSLMDASLHDLDGRKKSDEGKDLAAPADTFLVQHLSTKSTPTSNIQQKLWLIVRQRHQLDRASSHLRLDRLDAGAAHVSEAKKDIAVKTGPLTWRCI